MKRFFLFAFFVLLVAPSLAADRFTHMDADHNDAIVWKEFEASMPQMRRQAFDIIDANKDGQISREEWSAFSTRHGDQSRHAMKGTSTPQGDAQPQKPLINPPTK